MGHPLIDLTGARIGMLVVLRRAPDGKCGQTRWWVKCDCGTEKSVMACNLKPGNTISCGCERDRKRRAGRHGHSRVGQRTAEHKCWLGIRDRCRNPKNRAYKYYGGRGIKACARWDSFENFLADMGPRPSSAHSLDRVRVNGDYEPGNCRWATKKTQANNTTSNRYIEYRGKVLTAAQWAEIAGMKYCTLMQRLRMGWPIEDALWAPEAERSYWRNLARAKTHGSA